MQPKYLDFRLIALWAIFLIFIMTFGKLGASETLDTKFFYNGIEAAKFFKSLSERNIFHYLMTEFLDLGFIIVYTAVLFLNLKRVFYKVPKLKYFGIIPGLFDFLETKTVIDSLLSGTHSAHDYYWLGYMTLFKWLSGGFLLLLFVIKLGKITYVKILLPRG